MPSTTDIANRALSLLGARSTISSLAENSNEAFSANKWIDSTRRELLRLAPWNCATNFQNLSLICAAPGTPENPSQVLTTWQKGIPPPPWCYEYAYPVDCIRPLWIVPQFTTGFASGIPITTAVTGGAPNFWNGPPIKFKVGIDQIGANGLPSNTGTDMRVIWTNQQQALLSYLKNVLDPNIMDDQFIQAWAEIMAARMVIDLTGDKQLANLRIKTANDIIILARQGDGNEGLTINDVTPDWIRVRGIDFPNDYGWTPNEFAWGNLLTLY